MEMKYVWRIYVAAWLGASASVCMAIYATGNPWCLLALFFPACISFKSNGGSKNEQGAEESAREEES